MYYHDLERTSPLGGPFLGTCKKCGAPHLTAYDKLKPSCPVKDPPSEPVEVTLRPASVKVRAT